MCSITCRPGKGRGQFYRMLELLYAVEAQPVESDYGRALSYLSAKQRKRSLVVIFTDLTHGISLEGLVKHVSLLARRSLPLVVTISDPDVVQAAQQRPEDSQSAYQRMAAAQLLDQRQITLDRLRQQGVLTLRRARQPALHRRHQSLFGTKSQDNAIAKRT
jgi:uncharacterized protein (DUF58 family)